MNIREEIESKIGERVLINGWGDLAFDSEFKPLIDNAEKDIRIVKWTKGGLVLVEVNDKHRLAVPPKNITFWEEAKMVEVICPNCSFVQQERSFIDKRGWECRGCRMAWETTTDENTVRHLLANTGATRRVEVVIAEWPTELT